MATNYKTFKQLVWQLAEVKTKEELSNFMFEVDKSYQHGKITYEDNETFYALIKNVVKPEYYN